MLLDEHDIPWVGLDLKLPISGSKSVAHYQADICDGKRLQEIIQGEKPDIVVHLAARTDLYGKTLADYNANTAGVNNLIAAVRASSSIKRVIYTSSQLVCKVGYVPSSDTDYCPNTLYGKSKVRTEEIVRGADGGGVNWVLVRPTSVWGPYMGKHYQSMLQHVRARRYFHAGPCRYYKSYSYAGNIAYQYFKFCMASDKDIHRQTFYLADYKPLCLRDYIDGLSDAMGVARPIQVPLILARIIALGGDILNISGVRFPYNNFRLRNILTEYIFDLSKTEAVCGPLPYNFKQGVKATAEWFLKE